MTVFKQLTFKLLSQRWNQRLKDVEARAPIIVSSTWQDVMDIIVQHGYRNLVFIDCSGTLNFKPLMAIAAVCIPLESDWLSQMRFFQGVPNLLLISHGSCHETSGLMLDFDERQQRLVDHYREVARVAAALQTDWYILNSSKEDYYNSTFQNCEFQP